MRITIVTALTAVAIIAAASTSAAPTSSGSIDQRAIDICIQAFVAEIFPGKSLHLRFTGSRHDTDELGKGIAGAMDVPLTARTANGNEMLASGTCTVTSALKVTNLSMAVPDQAKLAKLTVKDIRLAANP